MTLRFGLLGTGYWAAEMHGAGLAAHPGADLVAVWGRDGAKAEALAKRYGATAYEDVDALLSEVDAVAVALPPDVQADLALRAARAGRHLLLDKPLALDTAAADRVAAAVEERGLGSVVFFTNRFRPDITAFLDETAAVGGWHGARMTQFASIFQPGNPYGASQWRREKGGLWDIGPHALSILWPVLGPVAEVTAVDGPDATVHLTLRHTGGAVSTASLTLDAPPAAGLRDCVFYGESGLATLPDGAGTAEEAFAAAVDRLVAGVPHPCDARFGADVVAVLAAAEVSARDGRKIAVIRD
ncbi:Gfo/Idh/MocA family protein [Phytohabitans rumicis]|uniref:Oxidoreductase n=1 Tax=Phytohabitans rumicis TaxID=1076125 RepID=A0A6V8L490_9ACTN|nr:Gfo/Idh/MocA family oxidoreductase [Phytohabitans rumicis]GFJ89459.1 oxidoreductase [Phytohabitans rumicis]